MAGTWWDHVVGRLRRRPDVSVAMKRDWDERARVNAKWFINTVKAEQTDEEFDEVGRREVDGLIGADLHFLTRGRDPRSLRVLEIGCGLGRMTRALADLFGEVEATDVSGEMVRRARERLRHLPNVTFHETSGLDCRALPSAAFDLVFSVYVFQHVPEAAAIRSNLVDAFRVLRPGGICKFQTMDFAGEEFARLPKDTWAGAAFTEPQLRGLARDLGARLIEISGQGTQYCWTTWSKWPHPQTAARRRDPSLAIRAAGRRGDRSSREVAAAGEAAVLSIVAEANGLPGLDANSLLVSVGGRSVAPDYVGPVDRRWPPAEDGSPFEVRARVPAGLQPGATAVALVAGEVVSAPAEVHLVPGEAPRCWIPVVQNALDGGTDVYTAGAKALIFITLNGVEEPAPAEVMVAVAGRMIEPLHVAAIPGKGGHLVQVQLPAGLGPGRTPLSVVLGDGRAATYDLELLEASREGA